MHARNGREKLGRIPRSLRILRSRQARSRHETARGKLASNLRSHSRAPRRRRSMSPTSRFSFALVASVMLGAATGATGCDDKPAPSQAVVAPAASASSAPLPFGPNATYVIEPSTSKVAWTGAKITASHEGSFSQFKGTITVPTGKPEEAQIHLEIDTPSLTT